mmetsp:Transcript_49507/g.94591  ORF Transcript_49507/g.94591 Transcript_49507/m.94591 type:complete len:206 (+) Transcript_49507:730-1347(+)
MHQVCGVRRSSLLHCPRRWQALFNRGMRESCQARTQQSRPALHQPRRRLEVQVPRMCARRRLWHHRFLFEPRRRAAVRDGGVRQARQVRGRALSEPWWGHEMRRGGVRLHGARAHRLLQSSWRGQAMPADWMPEGSGPRELGSLRGARRREKMPTRGVQQTGPRPVSGVVHATWWSGSLCHRGLHKYLVKRSHWHVWNSWRRKAV